MFHTNEKLYNTYVRKNMSTIVSVVKVREIMLYLPCLTSHDRETIEAKREMCGNYNAMVLLLECLRRRENWPEQFIAALESCEQPTVAAAIRKEYNSLRGFNLPNPIPESGSSREASIVPPSEASVPPQPIIQALSELVAHTPPSLQIPVQPASPQTSPAQAPKAASPLQLVPENPQPPEATVPIPPSPETYCYPATTPSPPQRRINAQQEPKANFDELKDGHKIGIPNIASTLDCEVSVKIPEPSHPDRQDNPSYSDHLRTPAIKVSPSQNVPLNQAVVMTPKKPPVQETTPPRDMVPSSVLQPGQTSKPAAGLDLQRHPQAETTNTASNQMMDASCLDDNTVCLSKPGQLISVQPQDHTSPTIALSGAQVEPYSGNSDRLEISNADSDPGTAIHVPACSVGNPTPLSGIYVLPCQDNDTAVETLRYNEPEENHYESLCQSSLDLEDVRENVLHVVEEPSVLNLDGRASRLQGEMAKETTSAPPSATAVNLTSPCNAKCPPSEPVPADCKPELKNLQETEETMSSNSKLYFLTAVGVGIGALLLVWKWKK
ncbi:mitochondrial antiviral-signaling protein isoform X2 [Thalassophryne amazonica]|uniref:mitochondrial antiviral-signaling protein isoform X2 n=1 Tax=Thalassophryne amazonica TaxID=390379 RepID=UPI001471D939|nr:mitochondrial antiviral-signaling protein isoform X2 [Thalassophryne amazonica]